jgi:hypothetical protein
MSARHPAYAEPPLLGASLAAALDSEIARLTRRLPDMPTHHRSAMQRRLDDLCARQQAAFREALAGSVAR